MSLAHGRCPLSSFSRKESLNLWFFLPRINDLEEEVRELQIASGEQEELEQKRTREMIARVEREKQLELENCAIR